MKRLHIATNLSLPAEAITQTFAVLGKRGAGKSNLGVVMAEEMHAAGLPFVVVDPVSAWWGLRSSRDGTGPGLPVPIFGGEHGDVPLERTGGMLLADLVVDERLSCVLDVSEFSEGDKIRFLIDFAERLFRRNRDPLHLFLEEADDYAPQRPMREAVRMLGAWQRIVKRGRGRGLGATSITQRSASINKDVLTQTETLFVFRTTSPQDRKAIEGWLEFHGQSKEVLESLPALKNGECWVWSPHWLGKLERVKVRMRQTYDSGATPTSLQGRRAPATLADVDLGRIRKDMAATIERVKQTDPKELRAEVARLQAELHTANTFISLQKPKTADPVRAKAVRIEIPVLKGDQLRRTERALSLAAKYAETFERAMHQLERIVGASADPFAHARATVGDLKAAIVAGTSSPVKTQSPPSPMPPHLRSMPLQRFEVPSSAIPLPVGERLILIAAAAQHPDGATRRHLTVSTGYKRSTRDAYLQRLRERAYVLVSSSGRIVATSTGIAALGDAYESLPTGPALREYWMRRLPEGERKILSAVLEAYPEAVNREQLSEATGYKRSTRDAYLQRLRVRELITTNGRAGSVRAEEILF